MTTFPVLQLSDPMRAAYDMLIKAGKNGAHQAHLLTLLYGDEADRTPLKYVGSRLARLRDKLKPLGFDIRGTGRGGQPDGRFILYCVADETVEQPVDSGRIRVEMVAGIASYQHVVGPAFDTAGSRVRLPFVASLHEARP